MTAWGQASAPGARSRLRFRRPGSAGPPKRLAPPCPTRTPAPPTTAVGRAPRQTGRWVLRPVSEPARGWRCPPGLPCPSKPGQRRARRALTASRAALLAASCASASSWPQARWVVACPTCPAGPAGRATWTEFDDAPAAREEPTEGDPRSDTPPRARHPCSDGTRPPCLVHRPDDFTYAHRLIHVLLPHLFVFRVFKMKREIGARI